MTEVHGTGWDGQGWTGVDRGGRVGRMDGRRKFRTTPHAPSPAGQRWGHLSAQGFDFILLLLKVGGVKGSRDLHHVPPNFPHHPGHTRGQL